MSIQVARIQPITLMPWKYPELAKTDAFDPAANLTVSRGTIMGQVGAGNNDVDTVTLNNTPTSGTFAITVANNAGTYTALAIPYNATTATVQAAIQGLPNVGNGNVLVTGTAGASYILASAGFLNNQSLGVVTSDGTLLTGAGAQPTATVVHTTSYLTAGSVRPYASGNTDGSQVPLGPSMYDFSTDAQGNTVLGIGTAFGLPLGHVETIPIYFCGYFRKADLIGLDTNAITLMFGRSFQTSDGTGALLIPC